MVRRIAFLLACAVFAAAGPLRAPAQEQAGPRLENASGILTIDPERLYQESRFGRQVEAELERARQSLKEENDRLDAELSAEEESLAERRAEMAPEEFRALADAFDAKVEAIRAEQEEKLRALTRRREEERQAFFNAVLPVLSQIVRERRGVVVLERRMVFMSADTIDITGDVIERLDRAMEERQEPPAPEEDGDGTATGGEAPADE